MFEGNQLGERKNIAQVIILVKDHTKRLANLDLGVQEIDEFTCSDILV